MLPSQSPFPCHWWGIGLEHVGLGAVRPDVGTYGLFAFDRLPPLPFELNGDFAWLASAPTHEHHVGKERAGENAQAYELLQEVSARMGLRLPDPFMRFMAESSLHQRVRSNTDCLLDLCREPIPAPIGGGHLIRFLADSQGCIFWYVYLTPDRVRRRVLRDVHVQVLAGE
jgi:hypothetical protein